MFPTLSFSWTFSSIFRLFEHDFHPLPEFLRAGLLSAAGSAGSALPSVHSEQDSPPVPSSLPPFPWIPAEPTPSPVGSQPGNAKAQNQQACPNFSVLFWYASGKIPTARNPLIITFQKCFPLPQTANI